MDLKRKYLRVIDEVEKNKADIAIIFVCSVLNKSKVHFDYEDFSISASFQTEADLSDYNDAVRKSGIYTKTFLCERDFFRWVLAGKLAALPHKYKYVYTSAVNGIGPGRRALVPAFCSHFGIQTLNQTPHSATMARHKHNASHLLNNLEIPSAKCWMFMENETWLNDKAPPEGLRVIAKATYEGSSIGMKEDSVFIFNSESLDYLRSLSAKLKQPLSIQKFINGMEFEIPVFEINNTRLATPVLVMEGIHALSNRRILNYDIVANDNYRFSTNYNIDKSLYRRMQDTAIRAAKALEFRNISRIDVRLTDDGDIYIFDVSGTPDLSKMSSCANAMEIFDEGYHKLWLFSIASAFYKETVGHSQP